MTVCVCVCVCACVRACVFFRIAPLVDLWSHMLIYPRNATITDSATVAFPGHINLFIDITSHIL